MNPMRISFFACAKDEEFATAKKIRIVEELHHLFERLEPRERVMLAHRIRRDVAENGIDFSLMAPDVEELEHQL